jgi:ATP-dependent DNA ligase
LLQGTVALNSRASQKTLSFGAKPKPLMAREVLTQFRKITETKGTGSQGDKVDIISKMAVRCQGSEAK